MLQRKSVTTCGYCGEQICNENEITVICVDNTVHTDLWLPAVECVRCSKHTESYSAECVTYADVVQSMIQQYDSVYTSDKKGLDRLYDAIITLHRIAVSEFSKSTKVLHLAEQEYRRGGYITTIKAGCRLTSADKLQVRRIVILERVLSVIADKVYTLTSKHNVTAGEYAEVIQSVLASLTVQ